MREKISAGVAAATYLAFDQTRKRVSIVLVGEGIAEEAALKIGVMATKDLRAALDIARAHHGPHARIGVVTHGAEIMECFK